jgi:hypothetical protein
MPQEGIIRREFVPLRGIDLGDAARDARLQGWRSQ